MGASSGSKESIQRDIDSKLSELESLKRQLESFKEQLARDRSRKDVNLQSIKRNIESKKDEIKRCQESIKRLRERKKNA